MSHLLKTKQKIAGIMALAMFFSMFVGSFSSPVLASNERIDNSDVIIPLAVPKENKAKKLVSKAGLLGAVVAGTIVAISGLPMLTVAAGAAVGYASVVLTKKAIGLFRGKKNEEMPVADAIPQKTVDDATAEQEAARVHKFIARLNGPSASSNEQSLTTATEALSPVVPVRNSNDVSNSKESYDAYEKAYKEYLAAIQDGDASLANEKFAEYKKCQEIYKQQIK